MVAPLRLTKEKALAQAAMLPMQFRDMSAWAVFDVPTYTMGVKSENKIDNPNCDLLFKFNDTDYSWRDTNWVSISAYYTDLPLTLAKKDTLEQLTSLLLKMDAANISETTNCIKLWGPPCLGTQSSNGYQPS